VNVAIPSLTNLASVILLLTATSDARRATAIPATGLLLAAPRTASDSPDSTDPWDACQDIRAAIRKVADFKPAPTRGIIVRFLDEPTQSYDGCHVEASGIPAGKRDPMGDLLNDLRRKGWANHDDISADGPDGSVVGLRRGAVLCQVEGRWDGGDDSDPSYVPDPDVRLVIDCAQRR
jgi:hypothetical protein